MGVRMRAKTRLVIIVVFAALGGLLAAWLMPVVLDQIYVFVQKASAPALPQPIDASVESGQAVVPTGPTSKPVAKPGANGKQAAKPGLDHWGADKNRPPKLPQLGTADEASLVQETYPESRNPWTVVAMALLGAIVGASVGNFACNGIEAALRRWDDMEMGDKVTLFVGVFAGILASIPFLFVLQALGGIAAPTLTLLLTVGFSALAVLALRSMEEVLPWQRGRTRSRRSGIKILDTNVIIDGRIYDLARTGFLEGQLYIPGFVLQELQHIADSADALRRQRGRRGLDVLRLMQDDFDIEVGTHDRFAADPEEEVDARLVRLAQALGGDIVSNDFNLNRVASIQNVRVLNVNDLALALRPNVLPGESLEVTVIREGNQYGQGVAYLDDGTMVVVEQGKPFINETVKVNVTQVIQTERGKMIFADAPEIAVENGEAGPRTHRPMRESRGS